ncbi:hypothetical protein GQF61_05530 [Sphingobacterium sp. DK4209]|uniref:Lipoprotein n=1 Tax=Sphingobacterium zhuxiongii TaxID=2662364 RepID=A0A5Q0QAD5_9SPHI|nr:MULTISPECIES: hypothetical protein [unclassified Sphingobacterium]MVZ65307.1 hypothetical protein [Sphingobacterium sp. DK4209]QGA26396.1 hypothetical protein GFH32_08675 [Sphingobacterium sp. dk4302]
MNFKIKIPVVVLGLSIIIACNNNQTKQTVATSKDADTLTLVSEGKIVYENDTLVMSTIDSLPFFQAKAESTLPNPKDTLVYISDFAKAKEMLKGEVTFGGWNDAYKVDSTLEGEFIAFIRFQNGDTINPNYAKYTWDAGFVRYYPSERILLMEGGHTSDFSIDLNQGIAQVDLVGNPAYLLSSPSKKYRLNGYFPGQECSEYFIQQKGTTGYQLLGRLPLSVTEEGFDLCTITDIFWKNDHEFYFRNFFYGEVPDQRKKFFKVLIK